MKVFFDNCTSPVLAGTLDGYLRHRGDSAIHIRDLPCGRGASDIEWINFLKSSDDRWIVFTGDLRIHRNKAERQAFRQAGLGGFVFASAYQSLPINQRASILLWRWRDIDDLVKLAAVPFLFELPVNRSTKIRSLPI